MNLGDLCRTPHLCTYAQTPSQQTSSSSSSISEKQVTHHQTTLSPLPLIVTLGYQSHRASYGDAAYLSGDGGHLSLTYQRDVLSGHSIRIGWGANLAYTVSSDREYLTPSAEALLNPDSTRSSESDLDAMPSYTPQTSLLARPEESDRQLGIRQRGSLGMSLSLRGAHTRWALTALGGGVWSSASSQSPIRWWGCLRARVSWLWISGGLGGDPCWGLLEARGRLLMGAYLGRAQLGVGWGTAEYQWDEIELDQGGPMGWVRVPLSAPLYLELHAWYPQRSRFGGRAGAGYLRGAGSGRVFAVSLSWTGETSAPERAAPKSQRAPSSPQTNQPTRPSNSPFTPQPSPLSPLSPPPSPSLSPPRPSTPPSGAPL